MYSRDQALEGLYFVLPQKQHPLTNKIERYHRDQPSQMPCLLRPQVGHISSIDLAYRQSREPSSSATLTVLGGRAESLPSDVEDLCLWSWVLRLRSRALPCVTVVAACSMAGRGLTRNAQLLVQKQGKLPGGERCGTRRSSCAACSLNRLRMMSQHHQCSVHSWAVSPYSFLHKRANAKYTRRVKHEPHSESVPRST